MPTQCPYRRTTTAALLAGAFVVAAPAQDLTALRQTLRDDLRSVHFAQSMIGLVSLSEELELSSARYSLQDESDTDMTVFAMPFHSRRPGTNGRFGLQFEGAIGYAEARQVVADLYGGLLPGNETSVRTKWRSYGVLLGAGPELTVTPDLHVAALVDVGIARIENDTNYGGPGAALTAALVDGIAFNWDGTAGIYGTGVRGDWHHAFDAQRRLDVIGRYDVRWTSMLASDDDAQDFTSRSQLLTLRADLTGPTSLLAWQQPVQWQLNTAVRGFPEQSLFGVHEYVQLGGTLLFATGDRIPFGKGFAVSAAVMVGEDFHGWTIGGRLLF